MDPSGDVLTTKKQVLIALINHVNKQAEHAGSSVTQHSPKISPVKSISASPAPFLSQIRQTRRMTAEPSTTDYERTLREHARKLKEHERRLEELDRLNRQTSLILHSVPEISDIGEANCVEEAELGMLVPVDS